MFNSSTYALLIDTDICTPSGENSYVSLPLSSTETATSNSPSDELWTDKINQLLELINTTSGFPSLLNNQSTTGAPAPAGPTTQSLVTLTPSSPSGTGSEGNILAISVQETDSHYIIHLPLYGDLESGEVTPLEIQVPKNGIQEQNGILTISELRLTGASFQDLVIDLNNNTLISGEMVFDNGTTVKIENGVITEYTSPQIEETKELLSQVLDSEGQPYYTLEEGEDPRALNERLREAYLRFQYDLLTGNISSDSLPEEGVSCIISNGENSIVIPPALLAQLEENDLIEYSQDGEYQLSISINGLGMEIPYPVRFNFKDEIYFDKLKYALEKGIIDRNGYVNLRIHTREGEDNLKIPFAFFLSELSTSDYPSQDNATLMAMDIYGFVNHYLRDLPSQGAFLIEFDTDQNLFEIWLPPTIHNNDIADLEQYFNKFQPLSTALIPGVNSLSILEQLEAMINRDFQDPNLNQIYHTLFTTARNEIQPLLSQLKEAIQSDKLEEGYSLLDKINGVLGTTMERAQLASMCIGYLQRIQQTQELTSKVRTLAAPDELNLYGMYLNDILKSMLEED
jgi:hypothetical protein